MVANYLTGTAFMLIVLLSTVPLMAILVNTYLIPLQTTYPFQPFCLVLGTLFAYLFMADRQKNLLEERHNASLNQALELEKEASRKAVEAGAVKSIFLANMSHDIRTPINAILGFADIIDRHPDDEASVRDAVMKIKSSGHVLLNLINDVLDLSKIENDKLQLKEAPADLNELTEGFRELFRPAMIQGELDFEIQKILLHPYVLCDEGKLQRILVNIINNAVKFTPKGGRIELSVSERPVGNNRGIYEFLVRDTGIGISKEFLAHIFEAFEQEESSMISNTSGAGLGLSIVKKLADLMKGTIEIDSAPGEGTAMKISFPFFRTQEKPDRALKRPDARIIPIYAMTANAFQEDIQKSKEAGITEHFSKPLDYEMLVRKIRENDRITGV